MNVLLVSQCSKQALPGTRRILDQFAERRGARVWQTAITQQGLDTLRKMLKRTARRNTAVACHWIRSKDHSELLWIVGNRARFNEQGTVPTNTTRRDILKSGDENNWHTAEAISLLAGIAGLFHDFGKANALFQKKLRPRSKLRSEPLRHEWVSLRLFQAFVADNNDSGWLERLAAVEPHEDEKLIQRVIKDGPEGTRNPFSKLPPLAKIIGWLIVSHHRLPKFNSTDGNAGPSIDRIDQWMTQKSFSAAWNSPQSEYRDHWQASDWQQVWQFDQGTPLRSQTWCKKAQTLAKRALKHAAFLEQDWMADRFSAHLARLTLMLADHCYSASDPTPAWQDKTFKAYANTDRKTKNLKQRLDEHNIGVGHNAVLLSKSLPKIRQTLPSISRHKGFKQRSKNAEFRWQDKAYELARGISERSAAQGFFGVNMASTGRGKTFANARIMYGLANEKLGCRFSVALGLRTLTLQTGDALAERLHLASDDLAVLIGSQAVRALHDLRTQSHTVQDKGKLSAEQSGSESAESLFAEHQYVRYDGSLDDGRLSQWLQQSPKLHQLLSAPVLVSTIDHLMPATEGERGGKQIAPMLRLLTSDLVLDEPDDFGLEDLPALTRLVNWAGMLGTRVLLSSATLPPSLIQSLFDAYRMGRESYNRVCGDPGQPTHICCAWFDEYGVALSDHGAPGSFAEAHRQFVDKRIKKLAQNTPLRWAELVDVQATSVEAPDVVDAMAECISDRIYRLHAAHQQTHPENGKQVSIGLVRMANINPMVAVAQRLLRQTAQPDHRIHFCIYHSQHPLLIRSKMEQVLDQALARHDPNQLWGLDAIQETLARYPEENHVFVVFATAVAEVGRDHDYDWAIAEPSSMRSLIQLAGRIQRHRQQQPPSANLLILNKNYKALTGAPVAFTRPGFESKDYALNSHDLNDILEREQYQHISATPRIKARSPLDSASNLVDLEHAHLEGRLSGSEQHGQIIHAALWWRHNATWCAELQRHSPFRKSVKDEQFVLFMEDEGDVPRWRQVHDTGELLPVDEWRFTRPEIQLGERVHPWIEHEAAALIEDLAEQLNMELADTSRKFAELRLRETDNPWSYHPVYGAYRTLV